MGFRFRGRDKAELDRRAASSDGGEGEVSLPHASPEGIGHGQLPLELGHETSHEEADFVVGEGNRLAFLHLTGWPAWPGPLTLLVGPEKSGKSHLARIWAARAGAIAPPPPEVQRLAGEGGATPLVIEDVDRAGYDEAALFHLLNQSMRDGRSLLLTARQPVGDWPYTTDDLRSRARLATLLRVTAPGDIELAQMLVKLFGDRQIAVDPKVVGYVAARMERSPAEAVALVELMDRLALAGKTAVTRAIAAEALRQRRLARGEDEYGVEAEAGDE
jgi:chromosomal replication initiation ATPase DnaA